jgi:hypothetical protein
MDLSVKDSEEFKQSCEKSIDLGKPALFLLSFQLHRIERRATWPARPPLAKHPTTCSLLESLSNQPIKRYTFPEVTPRINSVRPNTFHTSGPPGSLSPTVYWSAFCHCDKYLRKTIKEERFVLAHDFRGFKPWSAGAIAFRLEGRQKHHGRRVW